MPFSTDAEGNRRTKLIEPQSSDSDGESLNESEG